MEQKLEKLVIEFSKTIYAKEVDISDVEKAFSGLDILVYDFDHFKTECCRGGELLASCDCLKIVPYKQYLDIIEIKTIKQYAVYGVKRINDEKSLDAKIEKKVSKFDLDKKISDSICLYEKVIGRINDIDAGLKTTKHIKFFLLTDYTRGFNHFNIMMKFLQDKTSYSNPQKTDDHNYMIETKVDREFRRQTAASKFTMINRDELIRRYR